MPRISEVSKAQVGIYSFGRLRGKQPASLRYAINCTNLRDPRGHKTLTIAHNDGRAEEVKSWIKDDPRLPAIIDTVVMSVQLAIEAGEERYVTLGFWDHHGQWCAPAIAELVADELDRLGYNMYIQHLGV
jgi:hypothetical protein